MAELENQSPLKPERAVYTVLDFDLFREGNALAIAPKFQVSRMASFALTSNLVCSTSPHRSTRDAFRSSANWNRHRKRSATLTFILRTSFPTTVEQP